jgi:hypothetical protein
MSFRSTETGKDQQLQQLWREDVALEYRNRERQATTKWHEEVLLEYRSCESQTAATKFAKVEEDVLEYRNRESQRNTVNMSSSAKTVKPTSTRKSMNVRNLTVNPIAWTTLFLPFSALVPRSVYSVRSPLLLAFEHTRRIASTFH